MPIADAGGESPKSTAHPGSTLAPSSIAPPASFARKHITDPAPRLRQMTAIGCNTGLCYASDAQIALPRLLERVDHLARLVLGRRYDHLRRGVLELAEVVALDALKLHLQHPRLGPFAARLERYVAAHGFEGRAVDEVGERAVVEALGGLDGLPQDLQLRVAPRRQKIAQRIDAFGGRP